MIIRKRLNNYYGTQTWHCFILSLVHQCFLHGCPFQSYALESSRSQCRIRGKNHHVERLAQADALCCASIESPAPWNHSLAVFLDRSQCPRARQLATRPRNKNRRGRSGPEVRRSEFRRRSLLRCPAPGNQTSAHLSQPRCPCAVARQPRGSGHPIPSSAFSPAELWSLALVARL